MPSPLYIDGATGMVKGVSNAETSLKIDTFEVQPADPKAYSFDQYGGHDGFAHGFNPSITMSVTGEITSTESGVPVAQFGTAITFANESTFVMTDLMGTSTTADEGIAGVSTVGGFYPEDIRFTESRDGFRSMSITAISHPSIT